ncbi:MAG: hypothetical protein M1274_03640 [Actinobacteria bacterium]|nr:hypothetical protein [Actinomycetota bacterium]
MIDQEEARRRAVHRPKCVLYCKGPLEDHCLQIVTGFFDLAALDMIELSSAPRETEFGSTLLDAVIDGIRVRYDLRDGYNLANGAYGRTREDLVRLSSGADVVFKRSFDPWVQEKVGQGINIRPLGLNYLVTSRNVPFLGAGTRLYAEHVVRRSRIANAVLKMSYGRASWVERFEAPPGDPELPRVIFMARTWDPSSPEVSSIEFADERRRINEMRAACIRACREAFGEVFLGGFARLEHALREFPDCVVPTRVPTNRSAFLRLLKQATICVATTGLHDSIGWKMAEYVAASRPIVSEPLRYLLPGGFAPGKNYTEFHNPRSLVSAIDGLLRDKEERLAMATSNATYYHEWVRPEALVRRTIHQALFPSSWPDKIRAS